MIGYCKFCVHFAQCPPQVPDWGTSITREPDSERIKGLLCSLSHRQLLKLHVRLHKENMSVHIHPVQVFPPRPFCPTLSHQTINSSSREDSCHTFLLKVLNEIRKYREDVNKVCEDVQNNRKFKSEVLRSDINQHNFSSDKKHNNKVRAMVQ